MGRSSVTHCPGEMKEGGGRWVREKTQHDASRHDTRRPTRVALQTAVGDPKFLSRLCLHTHCVYEIQESHWLHFCSQEGGWQTSLAAGTCGPWWRGKPALQVEVGAERSSPGVRQNRLRTLPNGICLPGWILKLLWPVSPFPWSPLFLLVLPSPPTSSIGNRDGILQRG